MATGKFVVYYRVSTAKQGKTKLGLEAQKDDVARFLNGGTWKVIGELQEVESGKNKQRPQLSEALRLCRVHRATLLVAKQDRLSRSAAQIMTMLDDAKVPFVCVDDPNTTRLNVGIKAIIAEDEALKASVRTKAALAMARVRGKQLGGQRGEWRVATVALDGHKASLEARRARSAGRKADLMPMIEDIQASGITSLLGIATQLNERGAVTSRGTEANPGTWTATQVKRLLESA